MSRSPSPTRERPEASSPTRQLTGAPAVARNCKIEGAGLAQATVRDAATFQIFGYDADGERCTSGGDAFFVAIHGKGVRVRARVTDEKDGSYTVRYLCSQSGTYYINISLYGEGLPGSPFVCKVGTPTADVSHCVVSGNALKRAIARVQQVFEIQFKDAFGNTAHAEELDVYVEPLYKTPEELEAEQLAKEAAKAKADDEAARKKREEDSMSPELRAAIMGTRTSGSAQDVKKPNADKTGSPASSVHGSPGMKARPGSAPVPLLDLSMKEVIVTSKTPLVVRAGLELNSPRLGQLRHGRKITLLKIEDGGGEYIRACISLEESEEAHAAENQGSMLETWRAIYPERPIWWDAATEQMGLGSPREPSRQFRKQMPLGWVTIQKAGNQLVTPRTLLRAGERQLHMAAWARRQAVDKSIAATIASEKTAKKERQKSLEQLAKQKQDKSVFQNELASDPKGIGFAFGGVEPGRLHAHGQLVETHKVYYSIGVCGEYQLHIGLRNQAIPIPGSPFRVVVSPGGGHALSTALPKEALPLKGVVGKKDGKGCTVVMQAADKMGNKCHRGGDKVVCTCSNSDVLCKTEDNEDGTYLLSWMSETSGEFEVTVTIGDNNVYGTPTTLRLISEVPDLEKTEISGSGLQKAVCGKPSTIMLKLHDCYNNVASAPALLRLGLNVVRTAEKDENYKEKYSIDGRREGKKEDESWKTVKSDEFKGEWKGDHKSGFEFEMQYTLKKAGDLDLFIWAYYNDKPKERVLLPGPDPQAPESPYKMSCIASKADPTGSFIDRFCLLQPDTGLNAIKDVGKVNKQGSSKNLPLDVGKKEVQATSDMVLAGDDMVFKPQVRDKFGNPTGTAEGNLTLEVDTAEGERIALVPEISIKNGLTMYEAKYEPTLAGQYVCHVNLGGAPIAGSPVNFTCESAIPSAANSSIYCPDPPFFAMQNYEVILYAVDHYGNKCTRGGGSIHGRIQSATLPHGQEGQVPVTDNDDGTYVLTMHLVAPCDCKLMILIGNDGKDGKSGVGTELPAIPMNFISAKAAEKERLAKEKMERQAAAAAEQGGNSPPKGKLRGSKLMQSAGKEIVSAMGSSDERRAKVVHADEAVDMAVEGFKDAGKKKREKKLSASGSGTVSAFNSAGSALTSGGTISPMSSVGENKSPTSSFREPESDRTGKRSKSPMATSSMGSVGKSTDRSGTGSRSSGSR